MSSNLTCYYCGVSIHPSTPGATVDLVRVQFCATCWPEYVDATLVKPAPVCYGCNECGSAVNPLKHVLVVDEAREFFHTDCKQTFLDL